MTIMITGGAGYIGSHTCVELIKSGYSTVIFDNFINSQPEVLNRIEQNYRRFSGGGTGRCSRPRAAKGYDGQIPVPRGDLLCRTEVGR